MAVLSLVPRPQTPFGKDLVICCMHNHVLTGVTVSEPHTSHSKRMNEEIIIGKWIIPSLIPRHSHRPVFDRLQYAKREGEGLVSFII